MRENMFLLLWTLALCVARTLTRKWKLNNCLSFKSVIFMLSSFFQQFTGKRFVQAIRKSPKIIFHCSIFLSVDKYCTHKVFPTFSPLLLYNLSTVIHRHLSGWVPNRCFFSLSIPASWVLLWFGFGPSFCGSRFSIITDLPKK